MIENIGGTTSQLLTLALDLALARHQVIANNIANANTPGFIPKDIRFEQQLQALSQQLAFDNSAASQLALQDASQELKTSEALIQNDGDAVELDREMVKLADNTLRYQALLTAASKRGDIIKMAIKEGRTS